MISSTNEREGYFNYFWRRGEDFQEWGHCFLVFEIGLETVMMLMGVLFSGLMCYNEHAILKT